MSARTSGSVAPGSRPLGASGSVSARIGDWPGIRTFRSPAFRTIAAASLWLIGLVVLGTVMLHQVRDPRGEFAIDFSDYRTASLRMLDGRSPYAPEMLRGPVEAQGTDRYRYPPPFAQALTPLAVLPFESGAWVWFAGEAILIFLAVWIAAGAAGAAASVERFAWTGVAVTYFLPTFDALLKGNVNAILAFAFAALLARSARTAPARGGLLGAVTILKLTPIALLPAAWARDRRLAVAAGAVIAVVVAPSVALAPSAWSDYATVFPNLLAGSADYANNLAPSVVASRLGAGHDVAAALRFATLVAVVGLVAASVWLASRRGGWSAAVACAVLAGLIAPAAIWYQYLTVLLPVLTFAWVRAGALGRTAIALGGVAVSAALAWLPLATAGAAWLGGTALWVLWPRET